MNEMTIVKPILKTLEINKEKTFGRFQFEPLERGFGTTIGNSLRRVLLSSIPGVAVTSIKIDGVDHEFSAIPGFKEDVTELILNIKELALVLTAGDEGKIYIEVKGKGIITAKDIKTSGDVEIINPDLYIATTNEDANCFIEMTIKRGRGYVSSAQNREELPKEIGLIPTDSIYTPVQKVNYYVENTRVGQITDYDKLIIEVETNGTIAPDEALGVASVILTQHLDIIADLAPEETAPSINKEEDAPVDGSVLNMPVEELEFSVRLFNCVKRANINTVHDLVSRTESEIFRLKNLGKKSLEELMQKVQDLGLKFREED